MTRQKKLAIAAAVLTAIASVATAAGYGPDVSALRSAVCD